MPTYQVFELGTCHPYGSIELEGSVRPGDFILIRFEPSNSPYHDDVVRRAEPLHVKVQQVWHLEPREVGSCGGTLLYVSKHVDRLQIPINLRSSEQETPYRG
jgi:hypothetical protein